MGLAKYIHTWYVVGAACFRTQWDVHIYAYEGRWQRYAICPRADIAVAGRGLLYRTKPMACRG